MSLKKHSLRWFNGEIVVHIHETSGIEITNTQQKIKLQYKKHEVHTSSLLQARIKKNPVKKKEPTKDENESKISNCSVGIEQIDFEGRKLNSPILWVKVDPYFDFIRKVKSTKLM